MNRYPALIRQEPDTTYGVGFPDFPGCVAGGETFEEALVMAEEALALHVFELRQDSIPVPPPSDVEPESGSSLVFVPLLVPQF